jgi:uncharacterized protein (TIGR04255 family)
MQDEFFPNSPRVFYGKAPLKQVICQIRFPTILKIESEVPSQFQQDIRSLLPLSERSQSAASPFQIPKHIAEAFGGALGTNAYTFLTEDRKTSIELGSASLTYQTTAYHLWDDVLAILYPAVNSLEKNYEPSFYSRIGLRYVDTIDRVALGLQTTPWSELLNKVILGELAEHFIEENIEAIQKSIRVRNSDDKGGFLLQHGMTRMDRNTPGMYLIDFDFYVDQKTEKQDARTILDGLHSRAGLAWRWCITPKLHDALEPHTI